jgi:uncharacterized protein YlbG (UPF0298 family)
MKTNFKELLGNDDVSQIEIIKTSKKERFAVLYINMRYDNPLILDMKNMEVNKNDNN